MKKNILVYMQDGDLSPVGGQRGYNYHLKQQLDVMGETASNIHYLHSKNTVSENAQRFVNDISNKHLKYIATIIKSFLRKFWRLYGLRHKSSVDLTKYDVVHFHSTETMYEVKDSLKKYKGKVVLTTHSPTLLSKEIYAMLTPWEKKHMHWFYKNLIKMDEYAFSRADYFIFPCPEAEEPYFNNWNKYKIIKEQKKDCFRYLLTGTEKRYAKEKCEDVRRKYGIPQDAFVVCYVGRHNELKGYDLLLELGSTMLQGSSNVYFLIAGKEEPLKGLESDHWIEVGWTNDPHSIINASDIFILPNRETYFDLIMLEVLSLGKIVVASYTGGNRYFEKINAPGVFLYRDLKQAEEIILSTKNLNLEEKKKLEQSNIDLFDSTFTVKKFASNYVDVINSI